jgi:hypothetical protein
MSRLHVMACGELHCIQIAKEQHQERAIQYARAISAMCVAGLA